MDSFNWTEVFVTGMSDVDQQHKQLVDMINQFGKHLSENTLQFDDIEKTYKELADYAQYHFREEEALMIQMGLDARHVDSHVGKHRIFLDEITLMHSAIDPGNPDSSKHLLDFLVHWLAYHILGTDQDLARQVKAIEAGVDPQKAYATREKGKNDATAPLLTALSGLFEQVSSRNKELIQLNQSLEEMVATRTKALSDANLQLEELSLTDALTGLPNRRHAMRRLAFLWEESIQNDSPLVCMMIDADHFKEVNDGYGHDAGDKVLSELAQALKHSMRNDDVVGRLGGDEFFIICPTTDINGGMHIAESTRQIVSELRVPTGGEAWHGSISVGVASRSPDMKSYEELIKAADEAVYAAKRDGKNCVRGSD